MPGLNMGLIKSTMFPLAPLNRQQKFAERLSEHNSLWTQYNQSSEMMDALFASLQHRAFRGEL
jgi:type I restriction enzyme S subunit